MTVQFEKPPPFYFWRKKNKKKATGNHDLERASAGFPTRRFSAVHNVGPSPDKQDKYVYEVITSNVLKEPATLSQALIRQDLVYPLASFDISGQ